MGSMLTVAAVALGRSPRFPLRRRAGPRGTLFMLVPVLLPVLAGFLMSFQQAMNGTATVHYGHPDRRHAW